MKTKRRDHLPPTGKKPVPYQKPRWLPSEEEMGQIVDFCTRGASISELSAAMGINAQTFLNRINDGRTFREEASTGNGPKEPLDLDTGQPLDFKAKAALMVYSVEYYKYYRLACSEMAYHFDTKRSSHIVDVTEALLKKAKRGDVNAQKLYLKTQAGWVEQQKVEVTGANGGPVETRSRTTSVSVDTDGMSEDEIRERLDALDELI